MMRTVGFFGGNSKGHRSVFPSEAYYVDSRENHDVKVTAVDDFFLVRYEGGVGKETFGQDAKGRFLGGYAGYVENLEKLCEEWLQGREIAEGSALAELYGELGSETWGHLNGNYAAVMYDRKEKTVSLVSDRLGTSPLYYRNGRESLFFGTSFLGLNEVMGDRLDQRAVAEFLLFGYPLEDRTLVEGVKMMDGACVASFKGGLLSKRKYWVPSFRGVGRGSDVRALTEFLDEVLSRAVGRFCGEGNLGLAMSAGLDCRQIAVRVPERITLAAVNGNPHSHEVRGAAAVCRKLQIPMAVSFYDAEDFAQARADAFIANDGMIHTPEYLLLSRVLAQECNTLVLGVYGNGIRGQIGPDLLWRNKEWNRTKESLTMAANREYIPFDADGAFGQRVPRDLIMTAKETFLASFDEFKTDQPFNAALMQDVRYRNRRRIFPGLGVGRRLMEVRYPLTDNELVEFAYAIPWEVKVNHDVYRSSFVERYPDLAEICNQSGKGYLHEAKYGWLREWKRKVYYGSPAGVRYLLKPFLPVHANPGNRDVYHTTLREETIQSLGALVNHGILSRRFADKLLREQFSGYVNRYPLMHKLLTLASFVDGIGRWKGIPY
jgi:asparagine synthetase B (glutamine-hydrolysing)